MTLATAIHAQYPHQTARCQPLRAHLVQACQAFIDGGYCSGCNLKFAVPFIETSEAIAVDPLSVLRGAVEMGEGAQPKKELPADLEERFSQVAKSLSEVLDELRRRLTEHRILATRRKLQAEQAIEGERAIRQEFIERLRDMLPAVRAMEAEAKQYRKQK
jgi:hypothetical protein